VLYSTHAPLFLNVGRLDELAFVGHAAREGTTIRQPGPLPADESFRALSELDAERGELLLSRAALLVEGRTEKLAFPFIFRALGHDVDREAITIVECGGKSNMAIFIRICQAAGIPFLAVHDSDARAHGRPSRGERRLNAELAVLAGAGHTTMLTPDFEAVAGLHGSHHKPTRAWQRFSAAEPDAIPEPLRSVVETIVERAGTSLITG
jgi:predicted ATP-dependent endonuclease of OLD family